MMLPITSKRRIAVFFVFLVKRGFRGQEIKPAIEALLPGEISLKLFLDQSQLRFPTLCFANIKE